MSAEASDFRSLIIAGSVEAVRDLLKSGDKKLLNHPFSNGEYPIHAAADAKQAKVTELLLLAGANPNQESEEPGNHLGFTAAHYAASHGDVDTLQTLHNFKADFNRPSADKWTPLHVAAFKGSLAVITFLLDKGANVDPANNLGQTPILFSVSHGHVANVRFFIKQKADLKYVDMNGDTLLHHAFHFQLAKTFDGKYQMPESQLDVGVTLVLQGVSPETRNMDNEEATFFAQKQLPTLPAALSALFACREKLVRSTTEFNYLTLTSAKAEHFIAMSIPGDEANRLCELLAALDKERLSTRNGGSADGAPSQPAADPASEVKSNNGEAAIAAAQGKGSLFQVPAGHPSVSPDDLRNGEDPSGGKCPFFQKKNKGASPAPTNDSDKPLCPFSIAFLQRHQTTILVAVAAFLLGMYTDSVIDRLLPKR